MSAEHYPVERAARLLGRAGSTVWRWIREDSLPYALVVELVDGEKMLTKASVDAARRLLARNMELVYPDDLAAATADDAAPTAENERLRNTVQKLRQALAILNEACTKQNEAQAQSVTAQMRANDLVNDVLGEYTSPAIPDN
ncbi:hypothetical protein [Mycobacteroides salmoniphilum]|uniref:hypothetical protein n=1 Tax=Mycobacteroides salmoniphilum TaxID=404941 RepID=UPI0012FF85AB|nr:hypothetical protein [Mycobacteroides salmoniphilum]